jgi:hypothetical protein
MSKGQLIDVIRTHNPTADARFLSQFEERDLQQYLEHLRAAIDKRVHIYGFAKKRDGMRMAS